MSSTYPPLDVLVIVAHPDDAELGCAGTISKLKAAGKRVGIVDLTRGELGTRGTAETRAQEAADAARILNLDVRENLGLPDGFFQNVPEHQLPVVAAVRAHRPRIVITNAPEDRHPDHGRGASLVRDACFLAGLRRIETERDGHQQAVHRPERVLHLIQDRYLPPTLVVDISAHYEQKLKAVLAYRTQFYDPSREGQNDDEPQTHISSKAFLDFIRGRAQEMGHVIGALYGEGFITQLPLPADRSVLI